MHLKVLVSEAQLQASEFQVMTVEAKVQTIGEQVVEEFKGFKDFENEVAMDCLEAISCADFRFINSTFMTKVKFLIFNKFTK